MTRQNEEIAMLRETVHKMQASIAAFSSSESTPQCSANESLIHSVESEDTTSLDAVAGGEGTMNTTNNDSSSQRGQITAPQSQCKEITMPSARDAVQENEESQLGTATSDCETVVE